MDAATGADDPDWTVVREFIRDLKIACDDLHAEPFNPEARETVLRLLQKSSPAADSALERVAHVRQNNAAAHLRLLSEQGIQDGMSEALIERHDEGLRGH